MDVRKEEMPKKTIFTVPEMALRQGVSKNLLYKEIKEGRLHARRPRGAKRGYMLTDEAFNDWFNNETVDTSFLPQEV